MINRNILKNTKWTIKTLGEVSVFLDHLRKPITKSDRIEGEYNYYGANGKQGTINDYIFDYPTILLAEDGGNFGNFERTIAYKVDGKYWVNNHAHVIKPNEEIINFDFLLRVLEKYDVRPFINGATRQKLNKSDALLLEIPLPPLPEQQRIADILDKAEAITQKREQALVLCDEFLRATFLDMFGDPVSNTKGWEIDKLKNLTSKIGSGSTPRGGKESYLDSGMTLVRSLNIHDNEFVKKGLAFISKAQADKLSNVALEADDILLNITGASVCRCSMMDNSLLPARVNQHVCIIRPNGIDNIFLLHLLISKNFKRKLMTLATSGGATREALTKEDIKELVIIVPPIELQQKFSNIVKKVNGIKARIQDAQELPLFDALSQQAFKGELTQ